MPEPASDEWRELQTPTRRECPKLFYKFSTRKDGLKLVLTDLMAIWACALDKQEILRAAHVQQTSIDPSESVSQYKVLLSKLGQGLRDGDNYLVREKGETLRLLTKVSLPSPLKPLTWTFTLIPQGALEMAEQILRPCLHEVAVSKQKLQSLNRIVKEKDHVISRLLDKIENSAVDLSLIFPGITGLKSRRGIITVAEATRHVPGMATFDEDVWQSHFQDASSHGDFDSIGLSTLVSGRETCPKHTAKQHEEWLEDLPDSKQARHGDAMTQTLKDNSKNSEANQDDRETESEDDFERQATPPSMKSTSPEASKKSPSKRIGTRRRSSSESIDEAPEPVQKKAKPSKLGALARRKAASRSQKSKSLSPSSSPSPSPPKTRSSTQRRTSDTSTATLTATDSDAAADLKVTRGKTTASRLRSQQTEKPGTPTRDTRENSPSATPSQGHKLGRIGITKQKADGEKDVGPTSPVKGSKLPRESGGRHTNDDDTEGEDEDEELKKEYHPSASETRARSKPEVDSTNPSTPEDTQGTVTKESKVEEEVEETAEQRANRRREELKRTLNTSAAARKKRRF